MATLSPLQQLLTLPGSDIQVWMKRDDLNHPFIQGNKWRKLAPLLQDLPTSTGIFSFGGPFSNHLYALAAAGRYYGFPTAALVRGLSADLENETLSFAQACGMQLFPVSKTDYDRLKNAALLELFQYLKFDPPQTFQLLREGGDTEQGMLNCRSIAWEIKVQLPNLQNKRVLIAVPAGTGCTAAGVIAGAAGWADVWVFPAAPYGVDRDSIAARLEHAGIQEQAVFKVIEPLFPRKFSPKGQALLPFQRAFDEQHQIALDPVYTAKMMYNLDAMIKNGAVEAGTLVVALHTGGLRHTVANR